MTTAGFATRLRGRERLLGSWVVCDNPIGTESLAGLGFDFLCVDAQHGLLDHAAMLSAATAIGAAGAAAAVVRVAANDPAQICRALDCGASGVVVPLVDSADEAAAAVRACRYPPAGERSYGPMRSMLRTGLSPAQADERVACLVMVETAAAVADIDRICAVPGLDGVLVGPFDLTLSLGGSGYGDPAVADRLSAAMSTVVDAAARARLACGVHCPDGAIAAKRLASGFTFAMVSCDLMLMEQAATAALDDALRAHRTAP